MTKKEMIAEMMEGLHFANNDQVFSNRMRNTKARIEKVYLTFLNDRKNNDFYIACLSVR